MSVHPTPFSRHEIGHVDRFLHIATRLLEHLAHFAGHVTRELLFAFDDQLGSTKQDLGSLRRGCQAPGVERVACSLDGCRAVVDRRVWKQANEIVAICGIAILEHAARR